MSESPRHDARPVGPRLLGVGLFLPVPIVLWLFVRTPLGIGLSLAIGVAVMVSHRFYARPFALRHAGERCLWCGGPAHDGPSLTIREPGGITGWRSCTLAHRNRALATLGFSERARLLLRIGILGGLAVLLATGIAAALGHTERYPDAVAVFQFAVALAVLPLGWLGPRSDPPSGEPPRPPFPVHIQSLVGTVVVVWLFRIVGVLWLVRPVLHFVATR